MLTTFDWNTLNSDKDFVTYVNVEFGGCNLQ